MNLFNHVHNVSNLKLDVNIEFQLKGTSSRMGTSRHTPTHLQTHAHMGPRTFALESLAKFGN